jgi:hypothetical protein
MSKSSPRAWLGLDAKPSAANLSPVVLRPTLRTFSRRGYADSAGGLVGFRLWHLRDIPAINCLVARDFADFA